MIILLYRSINLKNITLNYGARHQREQTEGLHLYEVPKQTKQFCGGKISKWWPL